MLSPAVAALNELSELSWVCLCVNVCISVCACDIALRNAQFDHNGLRIWGGKAKGPHKDDLCQVAKLSAW